MKKYEHRSLLGKRNFRLMLIGIGLIVLGFFMMPRYGEIDPMVYDEDLLYGFRTTVIAPLLVLAGLVMQVFAIFAKNAGEV